jgi:DNA-binding SARP family transcriptional activator
LRLAPDSLALDPAAVAVDVCAFEQLVAEGTPAALEAASRTYRGDLLNGVSVDEAPFEEWLVGEQERLRELAVQALARLLAHQRKSEPDAAVQTALKLLSLDPLQEPVHRTLMRLYADHGRRAAALRQYRHCVEGLQRELGVGPEADTKQLYQEILARRATRSLAAPLEAEPGRMPLIGRDKELARLNERLDRASR